MAIQKRTVVKRPKKVDLEENKITKFGFHVKFDDDSKTYWVKNPVMVFGENDMMRTEVVVSIKTTDRFEVDTVSQAFFCHHIFEQKIKEIKPNASISIVGIREVT